MIKINDILITNIDLNQYSQLVSNLVRKVFLYIYNVLYRISRITPKFILNIFCWKERKIFVEAWTMINSDKKWFYYKKKSMYTFTWVKLIKIFILLKYINVSPEFSWSQHYTIPIIIYIPMPTHNFFLTRASIQICAPTYNQ